MIKNVLVRIFVSLPLLVVAVNAQDSVGAIEKARQAKEAADKAAAEAAAATEAAIEAAAAKAAKAARAEAKKKKEEEEARKIAEAKAAEEAELDAAASAAAEEAKRKMAAELGLEVTEVSGEEAIEENTVAEDEAEEVVAKESSGFNIGLTGSVGFVNGEYISNTPVGGSLVITTPWGFKLGSLDLGISFAFGSYSGEASDGSVQFNPTAMGIGANAILGKTIFSETHVGIVGAGTGVRSFAGITLERFLKDDLNLPFNILIGGEGFISMEPNEGNEEASYWGGLGVRLDYSL